MQLVVVKEARRGGQKICVVMHGEEVEEAMVIDEMVMHTHNLSRRDRQRAGGAEAKSEVKSFRPR